MLDTSKSLLIISAPRSGTFLLCDILNYYFSKKNGLEEIRNGENSMYRFKKKNKYKLPHVYYTHFFYIKQDTPRGRKKLPKHEIAERIEGINDTFGRNVILLTRRDKWEQFLSYYLRKESNHIHSYKEGTLSKKTEILFNTKRHLNIERIEKYRWQLQAENDDIFKNAWKECHHIYYEDWSSDPLNQLPELLPEFSDIQEYVIKKNMKKMNKKIPYPVDKESMFINIDEAKEKFEKTIGYL